MSQEKKIEQNPEIPEENLESVSGGKNIVVIWPSAEPSKTGGVNPLQPSKTGGVNPL